MKTVSMVPLLLAALVLAGCGGGGKSSGVMPEGHGGIDTSERRS